MSRRRLGPDQIELAAALRERGWSTTRIGNHLGVSPGCVAWHCLKLGADPPNARPITRRPGKVALRNGHVIRPFTPEEDEQLLSMASAGKRTCEMARALGRRHNSITGRLMTLARHEARLEEADAA